MAETHQISLPMEATPQAPPSLEETPQTLAIVQPQRTAPVEATQQEKPVGKRRRGKEETLQTLASVQPQRTAPVEATQQEKPAGKQRRGRRRIPMERIHNDVDRLITFSKRRAGIYKKAAEISTLCGVNVGMVIFSPAGKPYAYGVPDIESIADRFLWGVNPEAQNDNLPRIVTEAQRRANVGKLNNDCDELSVYLQNLKKEGDKLMELKKQTFVDGDCWWDIPVADLKADEMQKMTAAMQEIQKNASKRLKDFRASASSSSAVVRLEDIQMGGSEGFGYAGNGGFGDFTAGGSSTAPAGVQGYGGSAGSSSGFGDWRAGSSVVGVQGGDLPADGNGALSGYGGLGDWGASSSVQAAGMHMGGNEGTGFGGGGGVGGGIGDFTAGESSAASVQQGGMQMGEYGGGGFSGGDVAGGGIGQWRPVGSSAASLAVQPGGSSFLVGGNGGGGYGRGVAAGGGLRDAWRPVNSLLKFNLMQMTRNGGFGNFGGGVGGGGIGDWGAVGSPWMHMGGNRGFRHSDGVGGSSAGGVSVGGGGLGDWRVASSSTMQMCGNGGFGYNNGAGGGAGGGLGGWGAGGASSTLRPNLMQMGGNREHDFGGFGGVAGDVFGGGRGGFGNFTVGGSSSSALQPDPTGGPSFRGSFNNGGGGFGTN